LIRLADFSPIRCKNLISHDNRDFALIKKKEVNNMKTKYGNAKLLNGYYTITSRKEGNHNKRLHRLIFEDYHNCTLDKNDVIHHIDGDKMNNHPTNLICMSKNAHALIHNYNEDHNSYNNNVPSGEILLKLYNYGWSQRELADEFNVSPTCINKRIKKIKEDDS